MEASAENDKDVSGSGSENIVEYEHKIMLHVMRPEKVAKLLDEQAGVLSGLFTYIVSGESANLRKNIDISWLRLEASDYINRGEGDKQEAVMNARVNSLVYIDATLLEAAPQRVAVIKQLSMAVRKTILRHFFTADADAAAAAAAADAETTGNFLSNIFTVEGLSYKLLLQTRAGETVVFRRKALEWLLGKMEDIHHIGPGKRYCMVRGAEEIRDNFVQTWHDAYADRAASIIQDYPLLVRNCIRRGRDSEILMRLYDFEYTLKEIGQGPPKIVVTLPPGKEAEVAAETVPVTPARRNSNRRILGSTSDPINIDVSDIVLSGNHVHVETVCENNVIATRRGSLEIADMASEPVDTIRVRVHLYGAAATVSCFVQDAMMHNVFIARRNANGAHYLCARLPFTFLHSRQTEQ